MVVIYSSSENSVIWKHLDFTLSNVGKLSFFISCLTNLGVALCREQL